MGTDLLVIRKNEPEGWVNSSVETGFRTLADNLDKVSQLARSLGAEVSLVDLFDPIRGEAAFYEEIHGEEIPEDWLEQQELTWYEPAPAATALELALGGLKALTPEEVDAQYEQGEWLSGDIEACLKLLKEIEADGDLFCFDLFI